MTIGLVSQESNGGGAAAPSMTRQEAKRVVDEDQAEQRRLAEEVCRAILAQDPESTRSALLAFFERERRHFQREQEIMQRFGFPGFDGHRQAHERLLSIVEQLYNVLALEEVRKLDLSIMQFLDDTVQHVVETGAAFARHLDSLDDE